MRDQPLKAGVGALAVLVIVGLLMAQSSAIPQWQTDAGGKMAFEAASVKVNKSGEVGFHSNIPFTLSPTMPGVGGLMSMTNVPLRSVIALAYKLSVGQTRFLMPGLPSWVDSDRFDIEARAEGTPTKDQFRLMIQSLLADRFKLAMHHETRQLPVSALVLSKPGRTGPQLIPHIDDAKCGAEGQPAAPPAPVALAPLPCGAILIAGLPPSVPGLIKSGGRNLTLDYIAAFLTGTAYPGLDSERLVVNRTGLDGEYDFWMECVPSNGVLPNGDQPDPNGPTWLEALQEQLGLKLERQTGPVDVLVIDHVEQPSEN